MDQAKNVPLYADVPAELKRALERIVFERNQAGQRTTLKQVVIEALQEYVQKQRRD